MTDQDVDDYLAAVPEPHRSTLAHLRGTLATLLPAAEQSLAYGVPCFKVDGQAVAGFGYAKDHCTYFPMSGSITSELAGELEGLATAKGSIAFANEQALPDTLVQRLVEARQREIERSKA